MAADNRVAIITGSARPWSLGRATAVNLAKRGYHIAIADVRDDWGTEGAASLTRDSGVEAIYVRTDVSQRESVMAMAEQVVSKFGRIDALVNSAAIGGGSKTESFTDDEFHRVIGVNLLGPMLCAQAVIPAMKSRSYGRIVSIASTAPYNPPPVEQSSVSLYNASKGGLIGWTKSAAAELAQYGIVVNVVAVGGLSTAMGRDTAPTKEDDDRMANVVHRGLLPYGRVLHTDEAAEVIAFAADCPNHAMLGATIHASGGRVMPL